MVEPRWGSRLVAAWEYQARWDLVYWQPCRFAFRSLSLCTLALATGGSLAAVKAGSGLYLFHQKTHVIAGVGQGTVLGCRVVDHDDSTATRFRVPPQSTQQTAAALRVPWRPAWARHQFTKAEHQATSSGLAPMVVAAWYLRMRGLSSAPLSFTIAQTLVA